MNLSVLIDADGGVSLCRQEVRLWISQPSCGRVARRATCVEDGPTIPDCVQLPDLIEANELCWPILPDLCLAAQHEAAQPKPWRGGRVCGRIHEKASINCQCRHVRANGVGQDHQRRGRGCRGALVDEFALPPPGAQRAEDRLYHSRHLGDQPGCVDVVPLDDDIVG